MSPFAESGIVAARKRVERTIEALKKIAQCRSDDPFLWFQVGIAMEHASAADGALRDVLKIEEMATVDTQRPATGGE